MLFRGSAERNYAVGYKLSKISLTPQKRVNFSADLKREKASNFAGSKNCWSINTSDTSELSGQRCSRGRVGRGDSMQCLTFRNGKQFRHVNLAYNFAIMVSRFNVLFQK